MEENENVKTEKGNKRERIELIKVSKDSNVNKVAGAIAVMYKENGYAKIRTIGVVALNQAIKATIIARSMLAGDTEGGEEIAIIPSFSSVEINGEQMTSIDLKAVKIYG